MTTKTINKRRLEQISRGILSAVKKKDMSNVSCWQLSSDEKDIWCISAGWHGHPSDNENEKPHLDIKLSHIPVNKLLPRYDFDLLTPYHPVSESITGTEFTADETDTQETIDENVHRIIEAYDRISSL